MFVFYLFSRIFYRYLKLHDDRYKRLWFLWPSDRSLVTGKCGCVGGCAFFGRNRNGQRFFKPSRNDIQDGINIAALRFISFYCFYLKYIVLSYRLLFIF